MRRDSIFFQLFQQSPSLLFELLDSPPNNATEYRFDSIAVKETTFTIDGVFLPPESTPPGIIYLCEVQFQKDPELYERLFAETFPYLYRHRPQFSDWRAVVIYPNRAAEQDEWLPYDILLESYKVTRVYLNELGSIEQLPLGVALMVLTTLSEQQVPQAARDLLTRAQTEVTAPENRGIMEMISTILIYKFTSLSRDEVNAMLGYTMDELKQTRVYQEAKAEGEQIGRLEGERDLLLSQLSYGLGNIPDELQAWVGRLSQPQLEVLGKALLGFKSLADLQAWLQQQG
jgi:predicted transposase/invertase (TIGR01784 family)